jgi:hypothetical protein
VTIVREVSTALCVVCAAVVRIILVKMVAGKGSCSARLTRSYRLDPSPGETRAGLWIILGHAAPGLADTVTRSRATGARACPHAPNACAFNQGPLGSVTNATPHCNALAPVIDMMINDDPAAR